MPETLLQEYNKEFLDCVREIMHTSIKLNDPFERVTVMQWVRKLRQQNDEKLESSRIRNEYAQLLRIILQSDPILFCVPFKDAPPQGELAPLSEVLANNMTSKIADLPRAGPIRPVLSHKTADGRALLTVKRCPEGGVFCYLAVSPHNFTGCGGDN